jgi:hypothetical protein
MKGFTRLIVEDMGKEAILAQIEEQDTAGSDGGRPHYFHWFTASFMAVANHSACRLFLMERPRLTFFLACVMSTML